VVQDGGHVRSNKEFVLAQSDDDGRAGTGGNDLIRVGGSNHADRENARDILQSFPNSIFEITAGKIFFDKMGEDLCVGLRFEPVPLGCELFPELQIIFDNAVVNDNDFAGAIAVRVCVFFRGPSVRSPSRMSDTVKTREGIRADNLFEVAEFARSSTYLEALRIGENGYPGRIITSVFEPSQTIHYHGNCFPTANVADYSAHIYLSCLLARSV